MSLLDLNPNDLALLFDCRGSRLQIWAFICMFICKCKFVRWHLSIGEDFFVRLKNTEAVRRLAYSSVFKAGIC